MRITVLAENMVAERGLIAEHGLAFLIESEDRRVLFDTGQGKVLGPNLEALNISLEGLDAIVLSHGHYDHTGGLAQVLHAAPNARVYAHPKVLGRRYIQRQGKAFEIGMPEPCETALSQREDTAWITGPMELGAGITLTGPVPRTTKFEDTEGFYVDESCAVQDLIPDDQAIFSATDEGLAVVLGCAHAGVVNTLEYIRSIAGSRPIRLLIGGMHLVDASVDRLRKTAEALQGFNVQQLAPMHCTGLEAAFYLHTEFPGRCVHCPVGTALEI